MPGPARGRRGVGGEGVDEVVVQRPALQPAGRVDREQPLDAPLAVGLAAEAELAVDDRAAQRAFGVVVGRLDALVIGEGPSRRRRRKRLRRARRCTTACTEWI